MTIEQVLQMLPRYDVSLHIQHNEHKGIYEPAEDWIDENTMYDWRTVEQRQRAIDTDSIWTMQWYPNTPTGFNAVAAPSFPELLDWAANYDGTDASVLK